MNIITVDAGKFQTKGLYNGRGLIYRTKMEEVENELNTSKNGNFYVEWEGRHYLLGDGAKNVDYDITKHQLQHKLATYVTCANFLKNTPNTPLNLVVLSPLSMFSNPQAREGFRQFILNDGNIEFKLNSKYTNLNIKDVTIFAEACGVPLNNPSKFQNRTVGLLDIGGLNVNGVIIKNMKPVKNTHFTENLGSLILMEKIRKELNKEIEGANIQEYQMDSILKSGEYLGDIDTSKEIINQLLFEHFKEIIQIAKASNWDMKGLDIVVAGGGSLDIGIKNIKSHIPQAQLSDNPVWDSCIGGSKVGAMIYE